MSSVSFTSYRIRRVAAPTSSAPHRVFGIDSMCTITRPPKAGVGSSGSDPSARGLRSGWNTSTGTGPGDGIVLKDEAVPACVVELGSTADGPQADEAANAAMPKVT